MASKNQGLAPAGVAGKFFEGFSVGRGNKGTTLADAIKRPNKKESNNMKTKILLTLAVAILATATYNLYAGTGANLLRGVDPQKATAVPNNEVITINYTTPAETPRFVARAQSNPTKVVAGTEQADSMKTVKCPLNGTPKNIAMAGPNATMACCGKTVATCSVSTACGK